MSGKNLDTRRVKDVKPRGVRSDDGENYAYDNFKHRVQRRRLVELVGEATVKANELTEASRGKVKCADCPMMLAEDPAFPINRCPACALKAGYAETARLREEGTTLERVRRVGARRRSLPEASNGEVAALSPPGRRAHQSVR